MHPSFIHDVSQHTMQHTEHAGRMPAVRCCPNRARANTHQHVHSTLTVNMFVPGNIRANPPYFVRHLCSCPSVFGKLGRSLRLSGPADPSKQTKY